ncbi:MAG: acetate--CoA ligase [Vicingaceae bacterium]
MKIDEMDFRIKDFSEYQRTYQKSVEHPEGFWSEIAGYFNWHKKWDQVLQWNFREPDVKWFAGGKLNITENCLDRHAETNPDKIAFYWEPNEVNGQSRVFTYAELLQEVNKTANMLKSLGIKKGDRICLYLPMIPELAFAVLACARIGAVHSVVFAGFSARSLADRIIDGQCKMVITSDELLRGPKKVELKSIVDEAMQECPMVKTCLVYKHTGAAIDMNDRDIWWHRAIEGMSDQCQAEVMDSEDTLFILYTSGSTGKPKGVLHTCAGYMVYTAYSFTNVFQYQQGDVYWCTADIGWITGHSYIVYGPLLCGATSVMYEGTPAHPDAGRAWDIVDKYKVNIFYTAPTAIRALEACDIDLVRKHDLSTLRTLGTVGEPINEEAWHWYHKEVGHGNCPIVDTWWQTETGGIMISALSGITKLKPTFATLPLPGIQPIIVDDKGNEIKGNNVEGNLCINFPWPGMIRTTYGDHERCRLNYFDRFKDRYFTGDGCRRDEDGYYRITGRVDDVINVSGHRFGTAEIEDAIDEHEITVESAVVGYPHEIKGQGICAFVICHPHDKANDLLKEEISEIVRKMIGPIATPDKIFLVDGLPKTRSGKIMRRILRKIASGEKEGMGDISTLLDPGVVEAIIEKAGI